MDELEQKLLDGLRSGPSVPMDDKDWSEIEQEVQRRIAGRQGVEGHAAQPQAGRKAPRDVDSHFE
jgi:hypothetical protein